MPTVVELKAQCKKLGLKGYSKLKKDELIELLSKFHKKKPEPKKHDKKVKRCPNGTRRNKQTGECEKHGLKQKLVKEKHVKEKQKIVKEKQILTDIKKTQEEDKHFLKTLYSKLFKYRKGESKEIDTNKLKVVKTIGKGGFGETVLVQDTNTGKMYIRKESISGEESVMRYQYDMLLYLENKNICKDYFICPVKKYRDSNNKYYILFDYLDGYDIMFNLRHEVKNKRKLIAKDLVDLVLLLHKNNIVHNDLKNNNVMIDTKTHKVRIIDFGVATINTGKSYYRLRRGKSKITDAPKFDTYKEHTFKVLKENDMWALGNLIYWFLDGYYPLFKTKTQLKTANERLNRNIGTNNITFFSSSLL